MKRTRNEIEERRVEQLLTRLWRGIPTPSEHELHDIARSASAESRRVEPSAGRALRPKGWRLRLRWTVVAAAGALLIGSGLGFGIGTSVTPSGSAGTPFAGFGFLPARGWTVLQSGTLDSTGAGTAMAATVPLHPDDALGEVPGATLRSLPPRGVLIRATFTTRGDAGEDANFDASPLPLHVANATPVPARSGRSLAEYHLRAGVGGYNVDARIYFGTAPPSAQMLARAQRQLSRLVVQSERVTIVARPTVASASATVELFGSVDSRKEGEEVTIQAKDCGKSFFRVVAGTTTGAGGSWSTRYFPSITTSVRAVWNDVASRQVTIRQRAPITLSKTQVARGFTVRIVGKKSFWRKRVSIQRFDRRLGTWSTFRSVTLTQSGGTGGGGYVYSIAEFTARVPKGTQLRAVFPLSQARPCYLAGVSLPIRA
jgi:hypothetical protein